MVSAKPSLMARTVIDPPSTRERMIAEARALFAERGFYGVSIAQIAAELAMTKQALLHHFGTKEKLYGRVLESVSGELDAHLAHASRTLPGGADGVVELFVSMIPHTPEAMERSRLLMRELLDNRRRAGESETWYLAGFLARLVDLLRGCEGWGAVPDAEARVAIFQWLGAIEYSVISRPTLRGIYGPGASEAYWEVFPQRLAAMIRSDLARGPA